MSSKIVGETLSNIPWEERPDGSNDIVWRYSKNPIYDWKNRLIAVS